MSRRTLAAVQLATAAVVVLVLALAGGGRHPLPVDLAVYGAGAAMGATAVQQLADAHARRKGRHSAAPVHQDQPRPRPVPYTVWALAACAVVWSPWFIGPGGAERLDRWAPYALASLVLALAVGGVADAVRLSRLPDPADRRDHQARRLAITEAADWVITGRPDDDFAGRTLTPDMVQREAQIRAGLILTAEEAARALHERLIFRGFRAPNSPPADPR
ncbi:hypothetical protein [Streptomyces sp. NPDC002580]|uniref:hypothetical protein n=1 Tax=Streptomyces sp. NPDC002580 TaxID=3364653 RepID=UPI0036C1E8E6